MNSWTNSSSSERITTRAGIKKVSLEMGGKNAVVVAPSARLDLAVEGILWGAFGTTGQRCTATSRVIVHKDIHQRLVSMLSLETKKLKLGDGLHKGTQVGPLINEAQYNTVSSYMDIAREDGAYIVTGGKGNSQEGWFFEPTILDQVKPHMRVAREEIFGPVLSVLEYEDFDEALNIVNNTEYGLSSSVYTHDINEAFLAIEKIETGITYINAPTIGAEAHLPFGGVKGTGNGHREGGWPVYDFFSEIKTVYVDYSGKLQRAQIDNY